MEEVKLGKVDLIKIDIEGLELQALQGSLATLKRDKPVLVIEMNVKVDSKKSFEIVDYINELGYERVHILRSGGILSNTVKFDEIAIGGFKNLPRKNHKMVVFS